MLHQNHVMETPSQINIVRTAIACPDSPREVGDGMETVDKDFIIGSSRSATQLESGVSSGCSTPVLPHSPRSKGKRMSFQVPISQRSDDALSSGDSLPSPTSLDATAMKALRADKHLVEEKIALRDHLRIQVQVNQELKRLLVASIGEDMGFHYERIATEKAQIEIENEELKRKLLAQEEETERLNISCDVWRSKFLAGRVQCEELQDSLIATQRRQREMDTAVRALIQEHRLRTEHLEEMFETLKHLHDALHWQKEDSYLKGTAGVPQLDILEGNVDEKCLKLSHAVSSRLLGSFKPIQSKATGYKKYLQSWRKIIPHNLQYEVKPTMAEKYVTQLLQEHCSSFASPTREQIYASPVKKASSTIAGRFHPNVKHENLTLACCSRCRGDIHVV